MEAVTYSIIIPAYNEEDLLPKTLTAVSLAIQEVGQTAEIIVVDNNSTDATSTIAQAHGARTVFEPENQISRARNVGANVARGDYFIFLDADTLPSAMLIRAALSHLQNEKCCGGGAFLVFDKNAPKAAMLIARSWNWISSKLHLAAGSFLYCSREAFEELGGFSERLYASEEIQFSQRLKSWGKKRSMPFRIIKEFQVVTSSRKFERPERFILSMILAIFFPFSVFFKNLCGFWYKRPHTIEPIDDSIN